MKDIIFQTDKLICNILNDDEWDPIELDQHQRSGEFYWQCDSRNREEEKVWWSSRSSIK